VTLEKKPNFRVKTAFFETMFGAQRSEHRLMTSLLLNSYLNIHSLLECRLSHSELAEKCVMRSQQEVSRVLRGLKERGIVVSDGHKSILLNPRMVRSPDLRTPEDVRLAIANYDEVQNKSAFARKKRVTSFTAKEKKDLLLIAKRSGGVGRDFDPLAQLESEDVAVQEEAPRDSRGGRPREMRVRDLRTLGMFGPEDDSGAEDACGRAAGGGLPMAGEGPQGGD
jgi:hypothetical protein